MWVDRQGNMYEGDCQPGDRAASAEEITWQQFGTARTAKLAELDTACRAAITAGFASAALGSIHTYPAKDTDQQNLASSVLSSLMPNLPIDWSTPFWCADAEGEWAMRPHTATQIQQVGIDGKSAIISAIQRKAELQAAVLAVDLQALDAADQLAAIAWPAA